MASSSIALYWCLELVHDLLPDLADTDTVDAYYSQDNVPSGLWERVGLRRLEKLVASMNISSHHPPPPCNPDGSSFSLKLSYSTHAVLGWFQGISTSYVLEEGDSLVYDVQKYIYDKRATLPKLCVHLLEEMNPGLCLNERNCKRTKGPCTRPHRIIWTPEEVEALKRLFGKFAREGKNIPWRKIKEFGRTKFHKKRSPAQLKDKWRRLKKKKLQML